MASCSGNDSLKDPIQHDGASNSQSKSLPQKRNFTGNQKFQMLYLEQPAYIAKKLSYIMYDFLKFIESNNSLNHFKFILRLICKACQILPNSKLQCFFKNFPKRYLYVVLQNYLICIKKESASPDNIDSLDHFFSIIASYKYYFTSKAIPLCTRLGPDLKEVSEKFNKEYPQIWSRFEKLKIDKTQTQNTKESRQSTLKKRERKLSQKKSKVEELPQPSTNFRKISELPTLEDMQDFNPYLRKNIFKGTFTDSEHYLDVNFRLLKEDFIRPLREGLQEYRNLPIKNKNRVQEVRIYYNVTIKDTFYHKGDLLKKVTFDIKRLQHVDWNNTKRLIQGSLVLLSKDDFETYIFGLVSHRDSETIKCGEVKIKFFELQEYHLETFKMMESASLFEAYLHVLRALKTFSLLRFPFRKYIIHIQPCFTAPRYISESRRKFLVPLISKIASGTKRNKEISILKKRDWPTKEEVGLDEAQFQAFQGALTEEFCVIQGPPGTGKTFLGLKIVEALLLNKELCGRSSTTNSQNSPILIVCYTNHALDQFIDGIGEFTNKIVRIGGGCKNENLEKYKMYNKKKYVFNQDYFNLTDRCEIGIKSLVEEYTKIERTIIKASSHLLRYDLLRPFMSEFHFFQLIVHQNSIWLKEDKNNNLTAGALLEEEEKNIDNIWKLDLRTRQQLYALWLERYIKHGKQEMRELETEIASLFDLFQKVVDKRTIQVMKNSDVIAFTTTGAAKNIHLLQELKPKIVIVEEAAEVFEAHILTALSHNTEHLILIGDHQQLRPSPSVYHLGTKYNLDISLFERMITNKFKHHQLIVQHRMRPCISKLLVPHIYPTLKDHDSVLKYDNVLGMSKNMFFITHKNAEKIVSESSSYSNLFEAEYLIELSKYLIMQGYTVSQITILTTYTAQMFLLKSLAKEVSSLKFLRITVIDNYQGEENDIILVSFVRCNPNDVIGFLKTANRVNVSLSRARKGLYCIGDFNLLRRKSTLWDSIVSYLKKENFIGSSLQIQCQLHRNSQSEIKTSSDFTKYSPKGGCLHECFYKLQCGHMCNKKCHMDDLEHKEYLCPKPCVRIGHSHPCEKPCYINCFPCNRIVSKQIENCKHFIQIKCGLKPLKSLCYSRCSKILKCGHRCSKICKDRCGPCKTTITKEFPTCKHSITYECYNEPSSCKIQCNATLLCGHACTKTCSEPCGPCKVLVSKEAPKCHHIITFGCHSEPQNLLCQCTINLNVFEQPCSQLYMPCKELITNNQQSTHELSVTHSTNLPQEASLCDKTLVCGHKCQHLSSEQCNYCKVMVERAIPSCGHSITIPCFQDLNEIKCSENCSNVLPCGHICSKLCSEPCEPCKETVTRNFPTCSHQISILCSQNTNPHYFNLMKCEGLCDKTLTCGHKCLKYCRETCSPCSKSVTKIIPSCGHPVELPCSLKPLASHCLSRCNKILCCGHQCSLNCVDSPCKCSSYKLENKDCGHKRQIRCFSILDTKEETPCTEPCQKELSCGHLCSGVCTDCSTQKNHKPCDSLCQKLLICGHLCLVRCSQTCVPCLNDICRRECPHGICTHECSDPCTPCNNECEWKCPHYECSNKCGEICDRPPCNVPCPNTLECGHSCIGFCGELCPKCCRICSIDYIEQIFFGLAEGGDLEHEDEVTIWKIELLKDENIHFLELECGHVCEVNAFDSWLKNSNKFKVCPICNCAIFYNLRFGNVIKEHLGEFDNYIEKSSNFNNFFESVNKFQHKIVSKLKSFEQKAKHHFEECLMRFYKDCFEMFLDYKVLYYVKNSDIVLLCLLHNNVEYIMALKPLDDIEFYLSRNLLLEDIKRTLKSLSPDKIKDINIKVGDLYSLEINQQKQKENVAITEIERSVQGLKINGGITVIEN